MIPATEYLKRRRALLKQLDAESIVILPAAKEVIRNGDAHYPFRQDSDFYYLTGFAEPDAVLVLAPRSPAGEMLLFSRPRDPKKEQWDGPRLGQPRAKREWLFDAAYPMQQFTKQLPALLAGRRKIYTPLASPMLEACMREIVPAQTHAREASEL